MYQEIAESHIIFCQWTGENLLKSCRKESLHDTTPRSRVSPPCWLFPLTNQNRASTPNLSSRAYSTADGSEPHTEDILHEESDLFTRRVSAKIKSQTTMKFTGSPTQTLKKRILEQFHLTYHRKEIVQDSFSCLCELQKGRVSKGKNQSLIHLSLRYQNSTSPFNQA